MVKTPSINLAISLSIIFTFFLLTTSIPCSKYTFSSDQSFTSCTDLPYLNASLHWTRSQSSVVCIAYKAPQFPNGWIAWGVNSNGQSMVGTQALVAFQHSNGSMIAYPTPITSYSPSLKPNNKLSFPVYNVSAEYVKGEMIIFATLGLLGGGDGIASAKFNQVWQAGSSVVNDVPAVHSTAGDNVRSVGTVEFH